MGEGFVVLQTRNINVHLFMDEPGGLQVRSKIEATKHVSTS